MSRQPPPEVIAAARLAAAKWHVPPSIQLAQWAYEGAWGERLTGDFNCWGIKMIAGHPHRTVMTHEGTDPRSIPQEFACFASMAESFDYHGRLLATGAPYASFRAKLPNVQAAIYELGGGTPARPRYATAPAKKYGDGLWALISPRGNNFLRFDA